MTERGKSRTCQCNKKAEHWHDETFSTDRQGIAFKSVALVLLENERECGVIVCLLAKRRYRCLIDLLSGHVVGKRKSRQDLLRHTVNIRATLGPYSICRARTGGTQKQGCRRTAPLLIELPLKAPTARPNVFRQNERTADGDHQTDQDGKYRIALKPECCYQNGQGQQGDQTRCKPRCSLILVKPEHLSRHFPLPLSKVEVARKANSRCGLVPRDGGAWRYPRWRAADNRDARRH